MTLRDARSDLEATFFPGAGMLCSSLRHRGDELLWQAGDVAAYARDGKTTGVPLLYPWANRLADFDYKVAGKTIALPRDGSRVALDARGLPIHGAIAGHMAWNVVSPVARGDSALTAQMTWSDAQPELFELFPFQHDVEYALTVGAHRLDLSITVRATGSDPVPLAFGFHPYLTLPGIPREQWTIELPAMRRLILDEQQIPRERGEPLQGGRFTLATRTFDDGFEAVSPTARFAADAGRRLEVLFLDGYSCAQVFAPPGSQFICFEPMTAPANALRSGQGLRLLAPDDQFRARFAIRVSGAA